MKRSRSKASIVGLCDSVMHMVRTLRREYLQETASDRELLCGEWVRPDGRVCLRIRRVGGEYWLDECWSNTVNSRVQVFTFRLLKDEQGNLYTETQERAIGYDRERDRLLADSFGEFERKKENDDET